MQREGGGGGGGKEKVTAFTSLEQRKALCYYHPGKTDSQVKDRAIIVWLSTSSPAAPLRPQPGG